MSLRGQLLLQLVSRDSPCFTEGDLSVWMNQWS
jgi:hypothetical protein